MLRKQKAHDPGALFRRGAPPAVASSRIKGRNLVSPLGPIDETGSSMAAKARSAAGVRRGARTPGTGGSRELQVIAQIKTPHRPVSGSRIGAALAAFGCNEDIAKLTKKRQGVIDQLNHLSKGAKSQLDPVAACPKLRSLVAAENELVAYLTKNKEWCAVPDEALANLSASSGKSSAVANQACKIAAQVKKMQEQQAAGALNAPPGQKLPTGPL
jgi:hypothetical protein